MTARPLLMQVTALLLAVMLAVLALGFIVVLLTPTPSPSPMTIDATIRALQSPSHEPIDPDLAKRIDARPPQGPAAEWVVGAVADRTGLPRQDIRAVWLQSDTRTPVVQVLSVDTRTNADVEPVDVASFIADSNVALPAFELSRRLPDGSWLTISPRQQILGGWRLRLLAGSILGALAVLPIAWLAARGLTRPVRALAESARQLDLHGQGVSVDVSGPAEIQAAAIAFNAMRERIRTQTRERTRMVAAVAHDLRTPLTGLRIRAESAPPVQRDRMVADIRRMEKLVAQLVDFARGEEALPCLERIVLSTLIGEAAEAFRDRGADVVVALPDESAAVEADASMLRRAVDNLIENAVRYGHRARLSLVAAPDDLVIVIEDSGPGVPEAELPRLGEPFHRLEASRNSTTGGIGLGLSIVRRIVTLHGGQLRFSNLPAGGLRVELRLPAEKRRPAGSERLS
jgi:signal transduction histidine kinase